MRERKRRKPLRVGDLMEYRGERELGRIINSLAKRGIDAKPVPGENKVEILGFDRRR